MDCLSIFLDRGAYDIGSKRYTTSMSSYEEAKLDSNGRKYTEIREVLVIINPRRTIKRSRVLDYVVMF